MNEGLIARRYATALLKVAQKIGDKAAEIVYEKMKIFEKNYISHPDLHRALQNPFLSPRDKELLLSTAIGIQPKGLYIKAIRLIIKNHREVYVRSICLMYQKLYRQAYRIIRVRIITAKKMDDETINKIKELVTTGSDYKTEFVERVDPSLIGGFILRINSTQLDYSIKKELKEIRMQVK